MDNLTIAEIVAHYQMLPHPEGGYYKETYKSSGSISHNALPKGFAGNRAFSTAIYFLLDKGNFSGFHRLRSDECWHFYGGQTLHVYVLFEDGKLETIRLGSDVLNGESFQFVVPANTWFASEPAPGSEFSFVGCTVAPGFDFADFELAKADELSIQFPQHENIVKRLCRL